jgi:hypothetical protein
VSPWDKKTPSPSTGRPSEATREAVSLGRLLAQPRVDLRSFADQVVVATADQSIVSRIRSAQLTCPNIATTATPSRIVTGPLGNARNFPPSDVRKALNRSKSSRSSRQFGDDLADGSRVVSLSRDQDSAAASQRSWPAGQAHRQAIRLLSRFANGDGPVRLSQLVALA